MITVTISINGAPIYARSARNIGPLVGDQETLTSFAGMCVYKLDTGEEITHKRDDGAVALAHEMLKTIREV